MPIILEKGSFLLDIDAMASISHQNDKNGDPIARNGRADRAISLGHEEILAMWALAKRYPINAFFAVAPGLGIAVAFCLLIFG